jgi:hypothetical protein
MQLVTYPSHHHPLTKNLSISIFSKTLHIYAHDYNTPFLANSTFFANSPADHPPLEPQTAIPSPSSTLSSVFSHAQGQWCGNETHESVPGQRYSEQGAV